MPSTSNIDLGDGLVTAGLSAGSLNADLVPAMDVSAYKWLTLSIGTDTYPGGVLSFQADFGQGTWNEINLFDMITLDVSNSGQTTSATNIIIGTPIWFPFFRCRMKTYSSGTATGILYLKREGLPGFTMMTPQLRLFLGHQFAGLINNDGTATTTIASGHSANTVVYNNGTVMLARVLITTTNTNSMLIYDNATTNSGTVVGIIPANPTVGAVYEFRMPCANGITVAGNANNPGVTISYSQLV